MCESTYNTPGKLLQVAHISAHECKYRTCSTFLELKNKTIYKQMKKSMWTNCIILKKNITYYSRTIRYFIILQGRCLALTWVKLTQSRKQRLLPAGFVNRFECIFHVQMIEDFEKKALGFSRRRSSFCKLIFLCLSFRRHKENTFINYICHTVLCMYVWRKISNLRFGNSKRLTVNVFCRLIIANESFCSLDMSQRILYVCLNSE